jgi:hypothetical protein
MARLPREDRSTLTIACRSDLRMKGREAAPTPTGFAEIVSDYFPVLHVFQCAFTACSEPFAVWLCSVQPVRSLSVGPQSVHQFAFAVCQSGDETDASFEMSGTLASGALIISA